MAPIRGRPFLEHQISYWIAQGIDHFILSVGYQHEVISRYFGAKYENATIEYAIEKTPLGTGGGLLLAVETFRGCEEPFLLLNGDTYFDINLLKLKQYAFEKNADWCFSLLKSTVQDRYMGLEIDAKGEITSLICSQYGVEKFVNGGVYWIRPKVFENIPFSVGCASSLENEIIPTIQKLGYKLFGLEFNSTFIDIGLPEDYKRASIILP
jgi:D-glycero-alpha-D-manno-heptose 1-phosphate guanylyltransferase